MQRVTSLWQLGKKGFQFFHHALLHLLVLVIFCKRAKGVAGREGELLDESGQHLLRAVATHLFLRCALFPA